MSQADSQASLARLKQTLSQLQAVVTTLESQELNISATVLDTLVADTEKLVQQLQRPTIVTKITESTDPEDEWGDAVFAEPPQTKTPTKPTRPATTPSIRRRQQQPWWQQQKILIGAAAAAIAFIFIWKLTTGTPQVSSEVAQSEPSEVTEQVEPVTPQPAAPQAPEPAPTVVAEPEPPRPLTPEQRLIAAIQVQLDEVTQPYGDNIVRSIEADFAQSTLKITVGDAWYLLKEGLQDRLGKDVLKLAQVLDFKKMLVEDLAGNFVARNPVVGDRLVIMRRYQNFPEDY